MLAFDELLSYRTYTKVQEAYTQVILILTNSLIPNMAPISIICGCLFLAFTLYKLIKK